MPAQHRPGPESPGPAFGWDIGGANLKCARVAPGEPLMALSEPFEIQRDPTGLPAMLHAMLGRLGGGAGPAASAIHGVTMTAELSQLFRTKREGVTAILDAVRQVIPAERVRVWTTAGRFVAFDDARADPLPVAAANWLATATLVAARHPNALLVDVGSTTTDLIAITEGRVAAAGRTDTERLQEGELLYRGVLRTPAEAIVSTVTFRHRPLPVSAEGFCGTGDIYVALGRMEATQHGARTADGRPALREYALERIARLICADRESAAEDELVSIADQVAHAQRDQLREAILHQLRRHPGIDRVVVAGAGEFLAVWALEGAGLHISSLASDLGPVASSAAAAAAVALLL